jgi:excisionase family DNA binding protein
MGCSREYGEHAQGQRSCFGPRTSRRWIAAGELAGYRVGPRLLRVATNEVDALLTPIPTAAHPMPSTDPRC